MPDLSAPEAEGTVEVVLSAEERRIVERLWRVLCRWMSWAERVRLRVDFEWNFIRVRDEAYSVYVAGWDNRAGDECSTYQQSGEHE